MSGFSAFDISILGSVFAAQFGSPAGGAGGAVSPNANRQLSAAEIAKLPPWDQRQPKVNQTQEVRKIMAARSILDPDAAKWKNARAGTESDIKKLFAVHRAMDRLQTLSEAANRNGISGSERKRLNDRFQKGLKELDDYMTGMKLSRADLIKGKRHDKLETKEFRTVTGVLQGSNLTTIGPHVAIQDFANAQPFSFTITTEAGGPVEIDFDFAEMGNTVRSLDNVAAYMNGKLEQAGFDTRIRPEYRMDPNTGQYGWGLNLVRATGEELTFDDGTPAGPAPSGNLIVNGDFSEFANPLFVTIDGGNGQYDTLNGWTAWRNGQLQASPEFNLERRESTSDLGLDTDNRAGQDAYSQAVQTEAGKTYTLSWDSWRNVNATTAGTSDYEVLWNGQVVSVISADGDTSPRGYSINVTGTGGQDTLMFRERGADDSYGSIIDNIRLQEAMGPARSLGANMAVNGSFEINNLNGGTFYEGTLAGWTTISNGSAQNYTSGDNQINVAGNMPTRRGSDGTNAFVNLDGVVRQSIQTVTGATYQIDFATRAPGVIGNGNNLIEVRWNNQVVATVDTAADADWRNRTLDVVGTGGTDSLEFRSVGGDLQDGGSDLDGIQIRQVLGTGVSPPPPPSGPGAGVDLFGGAGGFENPNLTNQWQSYTSANGWSATGASGTFGVIDGTALNGHGSTEGNQVVELQGRDLSRTVATQAGQSYRLSFDYMNGDSGTQAEGAFQVLWNGQVVGTYNPQDTDWETEQLNVTGTGGNDTVTFRRLDTTNLNNGAWLDNITLNANPTPTGPNLVTNGSFESGSTGWTQSGVGFVNDPSRASNGTGTTIMSSINNGPGWSLSTNVAGTTAGQAYALEFDYGAFGTVGMGPEAGVRAIVRDAGGNVLASRDFYDSTQQNTAPAIYQKGRIDFAATGSNVTVQFVDINSGNSITDSMMLDNVSVRAIPTPVSPPPPPPPPSVAQGTEILVNGSFDTYSNQVWDLGVFSDAYQNVQGWTSTADAPASGLYNVFEVVYTGETGASTGIDTDFGDGEGDSFSQSVQTEAGRTYDLTFDYNAKAAALASNPDSAGFEVLWNGTVVGRYTPGDTSQRSAALQVTGTGGQDSLTFREIGTNDGQGSIITAVSLKAGAPVTGPLGGNLVSNGSFEANDIANNSFQYTNITGWTGITGSQVELQDQLVTPNPGTGQQYIELMNGGARQSITTVAGQVYQLDFASRFGNDGTAQSNAFEVWYNGSKIADVNPVQGQPWQNNTFTFTGAGGPADLEFRMKPGQENAEGAFIDAVQVRQVMGAGAAPPVNLIQNGSFEQLDSTPSWTFVDDSQLGLTTPTGWTSSAGSQTNILRSAAGNYASNGQNSLEIDAELGIDSISQSVQTVAGRVYDLRFDTRLGPTTDPSTADMEVLWNGAVVGTIRPSSQNFETMNFQVVGTGGNDTLTFRELAGQNNQKGAVIDNVSLTAAPATPPSGYGAELVTNGGFEANDIATNSFQFLNVTGWTGITGSQGELQDGSWAPQGSQVMELMNGGTRQSINTTAGKVYELNFASHRGWDGNAASHAFEVWYNGQMIADVAPQAGEGWKNNTFTFMGAGGPANLEFRMKPGQENAQGAMIDAVSVREVLPGSRPNLLRNGSFEVDDQVAGGYTYLDAPIGWTASNPGVNEVADTWNGIPGTQGSQWIEFSSNTLSQSVQTQAGQAYTFSFDYRGGDTGTGDQQRFRVRVNGQLLDQVDANNVNNWTGASYTFIGTGNDTVQFERLSGGKDSGVWLDNVAVRAQSVSPPPPPPGPNIVTNGSFEADNIATGGYVYLTAPAGWTASNPGVNEVADTWEGFPGTDGAQWIEFSSNTLSQALTTQAGQNYTFSFDFRGGDEGSGDQQRFRVRVNGQLMDLVDANGVGNWASRSYSFTGTGNDTIQFERLSGGVDTGVWLDNVQVRAQGVAPPPVAVGTNVITNGSFEGTNVANNSSADVVQAGWSTVLGTNGNRVDTLDYSGAPDGQQYAELDQAGGYRQVVNTEAGRVYTLDFDFKNNANGSLADNQFEVWWNGQKVGDYAPGSGQGWTNSQLTLVGTGRPTSLEFRTKTNTAGMSNFNGAHIDGIELRAGAVPASPNWGANLVTNGSFEDYGGAGGWANNAPNMANTQVAGFFGQLAGWTGNSNGGTGSGGDLVRGNSGAPIGTDGNVVVELDGVGGPNVDGLSQTVQTTAGTQYRLQFDLSRYNNVGTATSSVEVLWNGQVIGTAAPSATNGQWTTATFLVTGTGGNDSFQLREVGSQNDGGGALIDNVRLQANLSTSPPPPPPALGSNLVNNGSFEITPAPIADGNLANWTTIQGWNVGQGDYMEVINPLNGGGENASNGNYFLELDTDNVTQTEIYQSIATQAGKTYQISLDHKARQSYTGSATNGIEVIWNGQVVGDISSTDWQNWTTSTFTVMASGNNSQLMFREKGGNGDGFGAHMDNVRVQERLDIAAAAPASANVSSRTYGNDLLIDGSFENIAAGWGSTLGTTGWQSADNNLVEVWDAGMTGEHGGPGATNGQKYLELDRDMVRDEVWQDVQTQAGRTYQVDFNAFAKGNVSTTGNSVEVLWNGRVIGTVTPKADGKWDTSRFDVVGTGGMDRLSFRETAGGNNGHGPYLDNVRLREVTNAPVNDPNVAPDVLGLGSSNWDGGSRKIVDMTSARAGDEITIQVNDKRAATIRITDTMTMRDLAARLQREMGSAGTAKVVRGAKGERIDLDPKVANRVEILRSPNMRKDALEDLGLFEGVARKIGTSKDRKSPTFVSGVVGGRTTAADGRDGVFRAGKGINSKPIAAIEFSTDMRIDDKAEAKNAAEDLEGMMRRVRLAYRRVNGELDSTGNGTPQAVFSPREAARMAQYQRALSTLQQGPSTSLLLGGL